jgi:hypothetical protein
MHRALRRFRHAPRAPARGDRRAPSAPTGSPIYSGPATGSTPTAGTSTTATGNVVMARPTCATGSRPSSATTSGNPPGRGIPSWRRSADGAGRVSPTGNAHAGRNCTFRDPATNNALVDPRVRYLSEQPANDVTPLRRRRPPSAAGARGENAGRRTAGEPDLVPPTMPPCGRAARSGRGIAAPRLGPEICRETPIRR